MSKQDRRKERECPIIYLFDRRTRLLELGSFEKEEESTVVAEVDVRIKRVADTICWI